MSEKRFVKYGDKEMELPADMTLEAAKAQMSRFFPELANPEVKTEKAKDRTVYVFSKKAGHKGAGDLLYRVEHGMTTADDAKILQELIASLITLREAAVVVLEKQHIHDLARESARAERALLKVNANA